MNGGVITGDGVCVRTSMVRDPIGRTNILGSSVSTFHSRHHTGDRRQLTGGGVSSLVMLLT